MATILIDNNLYKGVEIYARQNNVSIRELVESSLRKLIVSGKEESYVRPVNELHPSVRTLIGLGRKAGDGEVKDINARDIKEEYLKEKYSE